MTIEIRELIIEAKVIESEKIHLRLMMKHFLLK